MVQKKQNSEKKVADGKKSDSGMKLLMLTWNAARKSVTDALTAYVKENENYVELDDTVSMEIIGEDDGRWSITFDALEWFVAEDSPVLEGCLLLKSKCFCHNNDKTERLVMDIEDYTMDEIYFAMRQIKNKQD